MRSNPYFQDELGGSSDPGFERLEELFVGRESERTLLRRLLLSGESARALVIGAAGVGKSSFVNRVKRDLTDDAEAPFWTHAPAIEMQSAWTALDFSAEVLKVVLRIVRRVSGGGGERASGVEPSWWAASAGALRSVLRGATGATDAWERVEQLVEGRMLRGLQLQGGLPAAQGGFGIQAAWAPPIVTPASLVEVAVDAIGLARRQTGRALLFHVNNLENLSAADQVHAAQVIRDVRAMLTAPGASWIFVGTTDVEQPIFRSAPQVSGFIPEAVVLPALRPADVDTLLERRYRFLQRGVEPPTPPVRREDAVSLYAAYVGDLRNYLRLLSDAALRGLDLHGGRSLAAADVVSLIGPDQVRAMEHSLSAANWRHFQRVVLGADATDSILTSFRHAEVKQRTGVKDPTANRLITELERGRWIVLDRTEGASRYYRISGAAAVGMAYLALADGRTVDGLLRVAAAPQSAALPSPELP